MAETIIFVISLSSVLVGADWLGDAAIYFSRSLKIPKIMIGATLISLVTTLPEITTAIFSAAEKEPLIGLGTSLGSPLVNIGLILGILLIFSKKWQQEAYYTRTIQIFLLCLIVVFLFSSGGSISPLLGLFLILLGFIYLIFESLIEKHEKGFIDRLGSQVKVVWHFFSNSKNFTYILYFFVGSFMLLAGAHFLVNSAVSLAAIFGVDELIIGLVVIAFGTSVPELFMAVSSIIKGQTAISAGNLFGASIITLTLALGTVSIFGRVEFDKSNILLMIGSLAILSSLSLVPLFGKISPKILGALSVIVYFAVFAWLTKL